MSNILNVVQISIIWILFFFSSVYGHVALKLAVKAEDASTAKGLWLSAISVWGWTAWLSWGASALLWMLLVAKTPLMAASSISSLRYILICLAAYWILRETISPKELIGIACISLGIILVAR
jgi:drug/metabolite transporter (DMT)-like permease